MSLETIAFSLYGTSFVLFVFYWVLYKRTLHMVGTGALFSAWLLHSVSMVSRWNSAEQLPVSGPFESAILLAWGGIGLYFLFRFSRASRPPLR